MDMKERRAQSLFLFWASCSVWFTCDARRHGAEEETMSDEKKIVTGLGKPELHRVLIRGHDLTKDLVGKITFSDMTYLMLVGRFPSDGERRMTDALLTILVEHGMVSSVVSARLCYSTAPEAMQAAVASSILGAGSGHLGSSEWSAKMLVKAFPTGRAARDIAAAASAVVKNDEE